MKCDEEFLLK